MYSFLTSQSPSAAGGGGELRSAPVFKLLKEHIAANPDIAGKVKAIFQWNITKDGETAAKWSKPL